MDGTRVSTSVGGIAWVIGIAAIPLGALLIYIGSRFKRLGARLDTTVGR